jgi:hypothetical protein
MGDEPAKGDRMAGRRRRLKKDYKVSKSMTEYHKRRRNAAPRGTISDKGEFGTMNNSFHHSPEERRRLAARIIEEAGGKAPKGVALVDCGDAGGAGEDGTEGERQTYRQTAPGGGLRA